MFLGEGRYFVEDNKMKPAMKCDMKPMSKTKLGKMIKKMKKGGK